MRSMCLCRHCQAIFFGAVAFDRGNTRATHPS